MKIAFDAKRALNNVAGLGQYSRILINALSRDFPENDYHLYSPKVKEFLNKELRSNHSLHLPETFFSKKIPSYWRSFGIMNDLIKDQIDVFHGLSNELPLNSHKTTSIKKVVTIHDVIFLKHKEQYSLIDRSIFDYKTRYACKYSDKIIAISEETKMDLIHFYKVPEEKIEVIYQSCSPLFYESVEDEKKSMIRLKYNLPDNFILNVSSYFPRKNHKAIIEALELLKDKTDLHVVFIGGQGNCKEEIKALIKRKKLESRVHMLSDVGNDDMPVIYQLANLFVYPSFFEGFGIPILEALFSKLPVIATKGNCFEEVGGQGSFYVDPTNAVELSEMIYEILSNSALRGRMIQAGLIQANSMKDDIFAKNTIAVYNA